MDPVFYDFCDKLRAGKYDDSLDTMISLLNQQKEKLLRAKLDKVNRIIASETVG